MTTARLVSQKGVLEATSEATLAATFQAIETAAAVAVVATTGTRITAMIETAMPMWQMTVTSDAMPARDPGSCRVTSTSTGTTSPGVQAAAVRSNACIC
jgi:hypothetical protein